MSDLFYFRTPGEVIWGLVTFTDWWQPATGSVLQVGRARHDAASDGIPTGLLGSLDERSELSRRMLHLAERDRLLLYLWYVRQLSVRDIAREVGLSTRQCHRRRAEAIRTIVRLGEPERAA